MGVSFWIPGMRRLALGFVLVGALGSSLCAQEAKTMLVEPPAPLLPSQIEEWRLEPQPTGAIMCSDQSERPESLVLGEDGLKCYERGVYRSTANANWTITVTARAMTDRRRATWLRSGSP